MAATLRQQGHRRARYVRLGTAALTPLHRLYLVGMGIIHRFRQLRARYVLSDIDVQQVVESRYIVLWVNMLLPIVLHVVLVELGTNVQVQMRSIFARRDISPLAVRLLVPSALPAHIVLILRLAQ